MVGLTAFYHIYIYPTNPAHPIHHIHPIHPKHPNPHSPAVQAVHVHGVGFSLHAHLGGERVGGRRKEGCKESG
jgi:hypothetical protein